MKKFTCVQDIGDLKSALAESFEIKKDRFKYVELGRNKTLLMIFFNSSLRTRLSTQKAALNLGMNVIVLDINQEPGNWKRNVASLWTATNQSICWKPFQLWDVIATLSVYVRLPASRTASTTITK